MKVYIKLLIPMVFVFGIVTLDCLDWHPIHAANSMYDASGESDNFIFLPVVQNNYCKAQYLDDFSDPGSGWPISDDTILYEYSNGEYRIWVKNWNTWAGAAPGIKASDFTVLVDVRSGPNHILPGSYGLLFGLSDDWTQFYTFAIYTEPGLYRLMKYESGVWTELSTGNASILQTSNQLRIVRTYTQIDAYLNAKLLTTISDGSFMGLRRLGLIATTNYFEGATDGFFDNFTICGASDITTNFIALQSSSRIIR